MEASNVWLANYFCMYTDYCSLTYTHIYTIELLTQDSENGQNEQSDDDDDEERDDVNNDNTESGKMANKWKVDTCRSNL